MTRKLLQFHQDTSVKLLQNTCGFEAIKIVDELSERMIRIVWRAHKVLSFIVVSEHFS